MDNKYADLIQQSFDWPQEDFLVHGEQLYWHDIPLMELIGTYGTPLKISYLPRIGQQIQKARALFHLAMAKADYQADYHYCYCTKSSHFAFVLDEVLKHKAHLETSSAFDIHIIEKLVGQGKLTNAHYIVCNGFKTAAYLDNIARLRENGFEHIIPVLDHAREADELAKRTSKPLDIGIRIASEEEPKFAFYTSRLGMGYKDIVPFYEERLKDDPQFRLKMLHFFINTGINDTAYYWSELLKCVHVYCALKEVCSELDSLNIGGGFPVKNSLGANFDHAYMAGEIIRQIKSVCNEKGVVVPHIFTEFGSYTVGESGATLFRIIDQKKQNDREHWNMIDGSFMTSLPDTWAINKRFILLAINRWDQPYERCLLGGLTCDSDDYYNSEQHSNAIYMPKKSADEDLYIGFFNTGAYQESLGGYGGIQHCLLPAPKHLLIDLDEQGKLQHRLFAEEQRPERMLNILGY